MLIKSSTIRILVGENLIILRDSFAVVEVDAHFPSEIWNFYYDRNSILNSTSLKTELIMNNNLIYT